MPPRARANADAAIHLAAAYNAADTSLLIATLVDAMGSIVIPDADKLRMRQIVLDLEYANSQRHYWLSRRLNPPRSTTSQTGA